MNALLDVQNLHVRFGDLAAVRGASLRVNKGETHCLVGESGCGKSVSALAIMGLLARGAQRDASVLSFDGENLLGRSEKEMSRLRGERMAMIFQEPMTSLNPAYTVGSQLAEVMIRHRGVTRAKALDRAAELLAKVRITSPGMRLSQFPHQLSGGLRQRVMIAMALSCNPKLLIADEPTTALDVTIQAQILELLNELKAKLGMAIMLITHDMGVIAETAQRVVVMYAAKVAEEAPVTELFKEPLHPYTQGLLRSIPRIDLAATQKTKLETIPGTVPTLRGPEKPGCRFAPRCAFAKPMHFENTPELKEVRPGHKVACFLY
jgi:peptide/nickel transport system ATP-binding protein